MEQIALCFGDSNTWGYDPATGNRHDYQNRWTSVLQSELGAEWRIIPEGLNGRTSTFDDPVEGDKNGRRHLPMLLESHAPVDLVIIMLGTNDLKRRFSAPASDIAAGVGALVEIVKSSDAGPGGRAPDVLVLVPGRLQRLSGFAEMFEDGTAKSNEFRRVFSEMCRLADVRHAAVDDAVVYSDLDGIHLSADGQRDLGRFVAEAVRAMPIPAAG